MAIIRPTWIDNQSVVASQTLARNAAVSGTLDLVDSVGAYIFARVGRTGTTALTSGVVVAITRKINHGSGVIIAHPGPVAPLLGLIAAAQSTTVNADASAGATTLGVASTASMAAEDDLLIGGATAREEWNKVARVINATSLLLKYPLRYAHTAAQADPVRNKADIYPPIWVQGGCIVDVLFDYGDDTTGESVIVEALAQVYDCDTTS